MYCFALQQGDRETTLLLYSPQIIWFDVGISSIHFIHLLPQGVVIHLYLIFGEFLLFFHVFLNVF